MLSFSRLKGMEFTVLEWERDGLFLVRRSLLGRFSVGFFVALSLENSRSFELSTVLARESSSRSGLKMLGLDFM